VGTDVEVGGSGDEEEGGGGSADPEMSTISDEQRTISGVQGGGG
jgi:hypothetical protein